MRHIVLAGLAALCLTVAGCVDPEDQQQSSCAAVGTGAQRLYRASLPELTYGVIDKMTLCGPPEMSPLVPIIVSSVTESQRLGQTSIFGNAIADFARTRLAYDHMNVAEPRLRSSLILKEDQGEMILSRDPRYLVTPPLYSAVLTGTYAVGGSNVFVSLKLIRSEDGHIISAGDFVASRGPDVDQLLGIANIPATR
jgi:hypothetical protein